MRAIMIGFGVVLSATAMAVAGGASPPSSGGGLPTGICDVDLGDPAAAFAVSELARSVGDLDELCGAGFTAQLREAASALPDEAVDPAGLVPTSDPMSPTEPGPDPSTVPGAAAVPALAGAAELVANGVAAPGQELDTLMTATAEFCANPASGADALVAVTLSFSDRVAGYTANRIAVTLVGEQCSPALDLLLGDLDFSR